MKCDKCKEGFMEKDGNIVLTSYPPRFHISVVVAGIERIIQYSIHIQNTYWSINEEENTLWKF